MKSLIFFSSFFFFFLTEVQLGYNVILVSDAQQSDSVLYIHIYVYIHTCEYISLFQILFPYRLLENIEHSSLCYTVGLCYLSILYIVVCIC